MTHSTRCLAHAIICAVENIRDNADDRMAMVDDYALTVDEAQNVVATTDYAAIGMGYLADGTVSCHCL